MDDTNERKVDLLAEAGQLLKAFVNGNEIMQLSVSELSSGEYKPADEFADSRAVILASAVLAVAGELRDIHNMLADVRDSNRAIGGSLAALVQSLEPDALYESAKTWGAQWWGAE